MTVSSTDLEVLVARLGTTLTALAAHEASLTVPVEAETWGVGGEPVPLVEAVRTARFQPTPIGSAWGPAWDTTWFRFRGTVPSEWAGRSVELRVDLGFSGWGPGFQAEGLVVDAEGRPLHGLHPRQCRHRVTSSAQGGERVEVLVEAAANPSVSSFGGDGAGAVNRTGGAPLYRLRSADLVVPDDRVAALIADLDVLGTLLAVGRPHVGEERLREVAEACSAACDLLTGGIDDEVVARARARVRPALARSAPDGTPRLSLVGHAHLDTAWLWPVRETVRKAVRTFANVVSLMDTNPDLTFAGTQAAQHAWVRDRHPELWQRVVARAEEGRWVPVGGMWVESDVLLPSGESLARQLIHGQRFFATTLGREARTGWLPDCFGYSPVLPQLLRQSGLDSFVTQKLSWNDTNRFPHVTFWWEGLDGSRVLAHFPTVNTYNADLGGNDLAQALRLDASGRCVPDSLTPFGYGDGGGGPTQQMLDRAARMRDLEGLPRVRHVDPDTFFAELPRDALPTWTGDLYLETHRGVWTSQRAMKLGDARCDEALREAEKWCATATVMLGTAYPHADLDALWKRHLLLEFHDILPGSSISRVHREAEREHADVLEATLVLRDAALTALGGAPPSVARRLTRPQQHGPADLVLDNGVLRALIDATGCVASLVDLATGAELVPQGERLGLLHLHDDQPTMFDAWNLDRSYLDGRTDLLDADHLELGVGEVVAVRRFGRSSARHAWRLPVGASTLELGLDVDWHEDERVLKLAWPLASSASHAAVGVQHGFVARSLRAQTPWEHARYEDWFHGFLHLDDGDRTLSLVTADVHGYDTVLSTEPAVVRLTLLRAPRFPDPDCDRGVHSFAVRLHVGDDLETVTRASAAARTALIPAGAGELVAPLAEVTGTGVLVDAIKLADDGSGDVVVRCHEALGQPTSARLQVLVPVASAVTTDLLERPITKPDGAVGRDLQLDLQPFELRTVRLRRG